MSARGDIPRRNFLIRSGQGLTASFAGLLGWPLPRPLAAQTTSAGNVSPWRPHYRVEGPFDALDREVKAGLDEFLAERDHDRIAAVLTQWSTGLLTSSPAVQPIAKVLAADFQGCSPQPAETHVVRNAPALEIRRLSFSSEAALGPVAYLHELQSEWSTYSQIFTAEFQVTRIAVSGARVETRVRYELVGTGAGFYRAQHAGEWDLEWDAGTLRRWYWLGETVSRTAKPWFADCTAHAFGGNSSYSDQLMHGVDYWRTVLDGACGIDIYGHNGVSVGDIDGDGFDDLYVCQPAGLPNRLYRNRGDGTFEDITESSGTGVLENTACALFADFLNHGRQDLVVVRANGPLLFVNEGGNQFRLRPDALRFAKPPQGTFTGAAAADYDRDGLLDIYFCLYSYYQGADQYKYPVPYYAAENGPPNFLMRNQGDGTFRDVTAETGLDRNNTRYSFCCAWNDYNGDGWPDLYVVNDFGRKNLYRNHGGTFTDVAAEAGVEDVGAGMSVAWTDYNNDGAADLYVANMWTAAGVRVSMQDAFHKNAPEPVRAFYRKHAMGNSLFRNGSGKFADVTADAQVGMGRWSWSSDVWDFDHDGFDDLYVANGMLSGPIREDLNSFFWRQVVARSPGDAKTSPDYEQGWNAINELIRADYTWSGFERNVCFVNHRDGTFSDVAGALGLDFIEDGRSFALADFDHDGRQELVVKNRNAPQVRLVRNVAEQLAPSIAFRLRGVKSNRDAIGAVVTVETDAGRQAKTLQAGSGFLSQHSKEVFFGLGTAKAMVKATIRWPSGLVQELERLPFGQRVWVEEGVAAVRMEPFHRAAPASASKQSGEWLPRSCETWLISPVAAPALPAGAVRGKPLWLQFRAPMDQAEDLAATYNILVRSIFDRHRDMELPTSFLIDERGDVVKVYQGPVSAAKVDADIHGIPRTRAERIAKALPFSGAAGTYEFGRNSLSIGSAFFQRGYYDQARTAFDQALRDDPGSAEACYGLGSVYLKQEKLPDARASFEHAVKLNASYPDTLPNAWNNLGLLATREGRMDEAIGHFREALRVTPDYWIALENLGNAYRVQKRWDDARQMLERALAARPQDAEAHYNLAMVFAQTGDTDRAYELLRKALKLRPAYPEALNNLGILYLRTGRRDEAVAQFEESIRVAPGFEQAYLNLARVYEIEGAPEKARAVRERFAKANPGRSRP